MLPQLALANKLAALAGASLIGTATAAAAISGNFPMSRPEPTPVAEVVQVTTTEPSEDEIVTEVAQLEADEIDVEAKETVKEEVLPPVDEFDEPYGTVACDDAKNHGEYVSGVAHDEALEGQGKGEIMSQAAKTSCGKDKTDKIEDNEDDEETVESSVDAADDDDDHDSDDVDDDSEKKSETGSKGKSENKGNGNGNGNGKKKNSNG